MTKDKTYYINLAKSTKPNSEEGMQRNAYRAKNRRQSPDLSVKEVPQRPDWVRIAQLEEENRRLRLLLFDLDDNRASIQ